mmetsp:Transcript_150825/g.420394  ORF Transcript_150825/g.420394 Transcript_150825/m.420394 type:complete len:359 (-) Transcript_150825:141-1217(-)
MDLPPNWARYVSAEGKEYFHNAQLNLTQWEKPVAAALPDSPSFHSGTSEVYKPTVSDLELHQRFSDAESGKLVGVNLEAAGPVEAAGKAPGGKVPTTESDNVSFAQMPSGPVGANADVGGGFGGLGSALVGGVIAAANAASSEDGAGMSGMAGSALAYAQQLFDVSSDDVIKRLRLALVPYPPQLGGSANDFRSRPDFWGPFWIATTAVLFLAATGNFARLLATDSNAVFKADYGLVSVAASMIYGFLVGVPLITRVALYFSGNEVGSINFRQMICVYGYSLAPTIPVSILCLLPLEGIRWVAVLMGLAVSLFFIRENLLADIAIEAPSLKWKMVLLFCVSQAVIFIVYRVHFFHSGS